MRGFTINDFEGKENLTLKDLQWYTLPSDEDYFDNKLKVFR